MKIIQITPGAGSDFRCDNCLRDNALVLELRRRGHDVLMVPLYLPMATDGPDASSGTPLFFGGVGVYMREKSAAFGRLPRWLQGALDSRRLLRWAGRRASMTKTADLGDPTLSMLRGEEGRQARELDRLVEWLSAEGRPDIVCLSNALLLGMARRLKAELAAPIVCMLQDEDAFLDSLPEPFREEAWRTVAARAAEVNAFIAVSRYYAGVTRTRLGLPADRVHVVHIGIDPAGFEPAPLPPDPPAIGYLSQKCHARGLDTLVEAFLALRAVGGTPGLRLRIAGGQTIEDREFVERVHRRLEESGAAGDVDNLGPLDRAGKQRFLQTVSVVAAPSRQGEAFGVFVLESLAAGVPVVMARRGAYPELAEATGGGVLVEPDDPRALAEAIGLLLARPGEARATGARGRAAVLERFTVGRMADALMHVFNHI
jgi:glycosyltransferase involved in cell wall biosynthesis